MISIRMKMPQSCLDCRFSTLFPNTNYWGCMAIPPKDFYRDARVFKMEDYYETRQTWCPLIEVDKRRAKE